MARMSEEPCEVKEGAAGCLSCPFDVLKCVPILDFDGAELVDDLCVLDAFGLYVFDAMLSFD